MSVVVDILEAMPKATPLAQWIYDFRTDGLNLTQADFARTLNTTLSTVQKWEAGLHTPMGPALALLTRLAHDHGFEPPPEVKLGRGPRKEK